MCVKAKILLISACNFQCERLRNSLEQQGYEVNTAASVQEAEQEICRHVYQLIILDVMLPDGNGIAFCAQWRGRGVTTPILFITSYDNEQDIIDCLDAGGNDCMCKPLRMDELLSRVRVQLR